MATETQQEQIARLKAEYLRFYSDLPVQKAAADFIGRDEDTIIKWRDADKEFADAVSRAKSDWARKNHRKTRPDVLLARLYDDLKPTPQEVDVTGTINHHVKDISALADLIKQSGFVPASPGDTREEG